MSCYYNFRCRACDVELDERGWNRAWAQLSAALEHRAALEAYAEVRNDAKVGLLVYEFPTTLERIAQFLLEHRGHEVYVVDEYGRERD